MLSLKNGMMSNFLTKDFIDVHSNIDILHIITDNNVNAVPQVGNVLVTQLETATRQFYFYPLLLF